MKSPIEKLLDELEYKPVENAAPGPGSVPYVTHEGKLQLGEVTLSVYVLNNGVRIIPEEEIKKYFPGIIK